MYEIRLRAVPEQLVVTEQRNVAQTDLVDWLRAGMGRVAKAAGEYGGLTDTTSWPHLRRADHPPEPVLFVVFHGNPNEGEVPVEVCGPIRPGREVPSGAAVRTEPAHREAYVRLTKAQTGPSLIGAAYGAVEEWVTAEGLEITAEPREVYFTDYLSAGPADEVFDVAFPVG